MGKESEKGGKTQRDRVGHKERKTKLIMWDKDNEREKQSERET